MNILKSKYFYSAPRYSSRRFPQHSFKNVSYKEDAKDTRTQEDLLNEINIRVGEQLNGIATKEEVAAIRASQEEAFKGVSLIELRELLDEKKGVMAMVVRQGLDLQRLSAKLGNAERDSMDMSIRGQIERWVKANKEKLEPSVVRRNRSIPSMELQFRIDSPMFVSTVNPTASMYIGKTTVEPGVNDIIRIEPIFWDYIRKGRTNSATYVWVNKYNALGEAAFIGPGVHKPGVSFSIKAETSVAKKIADSAKAGTELLTDIDGMVTFIEQELKYKIRIKANERAMIGNSATDSLDITGIRTMSIAFPAVSGILTANPNNMDVLRAGVGYLRSGLLTGPITIFINSIDATNMDLAKAVGDGHYLMPSWFSADGKKVAGATIVEDYNVPVGSVQFAFLDYYRILIYEDLMVEWGWENDDFTKNLVTAIGEMRLHQFFNSIYTGAFMFDTFDSIKAKILAP